MTIRVTGVLDARTLPVGWDIEAPISTGIRAYAGVSLDEWTRIADGTPTDSGRDSRGVPLDEGGELRATTRLGAILTQSRPESGMSTLPKRPTGIGEDGVE
jgi:hypothetical protein